MPDFAYIARSKTGAIEKDVMAAFNERAVADALRAQGLTPVSVKPFSKGLDLSAITSLFSSIKLIDKITFIKNLAVMIKAGLAVSRALKILTVQTPNKKFAKVIADISRQVESGTSLADAMAKYPNVFSQIFVSMVRVGEVSGNLEQNLGYLADQMQRDYNIVSKAKGAMTYPIVIMVALVIVGFLMFTFVLPKLTDTFKEFNSTLPFLTRMVITAVDVFAKYGIFVGIGLVGLVVAFMFWRKTETGKQVTHKLVLMIPVFSPIVKKINLARFVRTFSSLVRSGMPMVEALDVSSKVVGNIYYQQSIAEAASKVKIGSPLSSGFKKYPKLFTELVVQMMEVGEESGTTDTVLEEVASFYEAEVDESMKNLSSIIEPLIMMVIGAVVGVLAVALIMPIYNLGQNM